MAKNPLQDLSFKEFFTYSTVPIAIRDLEGRILEVNRAFCDMLEYSEKEFKQVPYENIIHSEDKNKYINNLKSLIDNKDSHSFKVEKRYISKSNLEIYAKVTTTKWYDGKKVRYLISQAEDITNIKKSNEKLRKIQERFSLTIAGSQNGIWDWDIQSGNIFWSKRFKEIIGYLDDEIDGSYDLFLDHVHPDHRKRVLRHAEDHLKKKKPFSIEYKIRKKDGSHIWVWSKGQALWDKDNSPIRMCGSITDINDLKIAEAKLKEKNEELERFVFMASHDLREPLRKIISFGSKIKENCNSQNTAYIERMNSSARRMQKLIADLLKYSRIGIDEDSEFENINMNKLIRDIKEDLIVSIEENKAKVSIHCPTEIRGEPTHIRALFQNLISNALKFKNRKEKPIIKVYSRTREASIHIFVEDNGIGIDPEYHKRIFECFQRLNGKSEYPGSGIGLAICKKIVDLHKGEIKVHSELNKGTSFEVIFPRNEVLG